MAQLVEHHLAKVRVAGSNPVVRSIVFDAHDAHAIRCLATPWQRSLFAVMPKAHLELQRRKVRGAGFRRRPWLDGHRQLTTSNYLDYSRQQTNCLDRQQATKKRPDGRFLNSGVGGGI